MIQNSLKIDYIYLTDQSSLADKISKFENLYYFQKNIKIVFHVKLHYGEKIF